MPNEIILPLRAKHFKYADYTEPCECGIANAAMEYFDTDDVGEGVYKLTVNGLIYEHEIYDASDFDADLALARAANFDDTIIRSITLKATRMKTIREHLETVPEPWRTQALENLQEAEADEQRETPAQAIKGAFIWATSPQGHHYWASFHRSLKSTTL